MSSDRISVKMKKDKSVKKRFVIVNRRLSTIFYPIYYSGKAAGKYCGCY